MAKKSLAPRPVSAVAPPTPAQVPPALTERVTEQATMVAGILARSGQDKRETLAQVAAVVQAALQSMAPRDAVEAMLASQMVAVHHAAMEALLYGSGSLDGRTSLGLGDSFAAQSAPRLEVATRLLRTFTMQVDTLAKWRNRGQQTVRVEHVTVESGGQAIVGAVAMGERGEG